MIFNRQEPGYADALSYLAGTLGGFRLTCSLVNPEFATGARGWAAVIPTMVKGSEQIAVWARATSGTPLLTLRVRELVGGTVVGSQRATMRLASAFRFDYITYQVRRPGASKLSVTISAASLPPGGAILVDNVTISLGSG